ncbi:peptidoglycan-binding protein [Pannonibacter phragmitetus]|uniref:peptidoglycan-binding domain-containing protein n=1 Tax=Pannonibacter phragmitetus TaxID=121719 RepID=UPI00067CBF9C|nr:peptidoglycan-binding domain-containing protein [Pannonibacter phragmitetus]KND21184.1 peptidoglycan-binding protein [Pannonibacter phragmitetus]
MARKRVDPEPPPREGLVARMGTAAMDNPVAAGGSIVMALTGCLIIANAVGLQPGRHPAPLVVTRERHSEVVPQENRAVMPQAVSTLVLDVQTELRRIGLYEGLLDGMVGPATERSIRRYEILTGLPESGEVNSALLARLLMETEGLVERAAASSSGGGGAVPLPRPSPFASPAHRNSAAAGGAAPAATAPQPPATIAALVEQSQPVRHVPLPTATGTVPVPPQEVGRGTQVAENGGGQLAKVQRLLSELGYGPLRADGMMSDNTANAIQRFELDRGLAITGQVSPSLIRELEEFTGIPFEG